MCSVIGAIIHKPEYDDFQKLEKVFYIKCIRNKLCYSSEEFGNNKNTLAIHRLDRKKSEVRVLVYDEHESISCHLLNLSNLLFVHQDCLLL